MRLVTPVGLLNFRRLNEARPTTATMHIFLTRRNTWIVYCREFTIIEFGHEIVEELRTPREMINYIYGLLGEEFAQSAQPYYGPRRESESIALGVVMALQTLHKVTIDEKRRRLESHEAVYGQAEEMLDRFKRSF